jgi:multidrug resistance efflux pump
MIRIGLWSLVLCGSLSATEYFAKAEPVDTFSLKAAVNGEVLKVLESKEGKRSDGEVLIMIDDEVNRLELTASQEKLHFLNANIKLSKESVQNSLKAKKIAQESYARIKNLSSYSKVQKEAKIVSSITSTNSYIQAKSSLENLKTQRSDLKLRIATLKNTIKKKNIHIKKDLYIYKIYPNVGDFVNMGSPLVDASDISQARLTIYVTKEELEGIEKKKIYIDDKVTNYKIDKLWQVADSQNISAYKVEIVIDKPKLFSMLMKVEFK